MPDQYQAGFATFHGLKFAVNPSVLIPRFETEQLVDEVGKFLRDEKIYDGKILEVGTGSGCVAITLAVMFPKLQVTASDVSLEALGVAKKNAQLHHVGSKITFIQANLLENLVSPFDVIVANLPYIPDSRIYELDSSVKDFEPHLALFGGPTGFELIEKLLTQVSNLKFKPKLVALEIDDTQAGLALHSASKHFPTSQTKILSDFARQDRVVLIEP